MPDRDNNISFLISPERAREIQLQLGLGPEGILTALQNGTLDVRATTSKQRPQRSTIKPSYQGEIKDANKERLNRSLSNYAANNFLLSTSNIRPDQYGNYSPELGTFAGNQGILTMSMGFEPFNASNYYKAATLFPKFRNWGLSRTLASELNNEVKVAGELGRNVGNVSKTQFVFPQFKNVTKTVQDNGKIRLSLPSHTDTNPRQFVLEPQGNNKFYVHMRTWDGNHIPANLSNEDKQTLFQALYDELPEGGEILFPKSGPGYYGTRGTIAGLQRLSRDSRFSPGTKGTLQYIDKDGTIKTYEGTSFIKKSIQEPRTSLRFFEQPQSRISKAEGAGTPKVERNQVVSQRDYPKGTAQQYIRIGSIARMDDNASYVRGFWRKGDYEKVFQGENDVVRIPDKYSPDGYYIKQKTKRNYFFSEGDPYSETRYRGNRKLLEKYNSREKVFGKDLPQEFYDYLEQIKDSQINPNFTNLMSKDIKYPYKGYTLFGDAPVREVSASDIQSKYVYDFRKYLEHLGYDTSKISDNQMLQLITDQYNSLTKGMSGKTKGQIFWHESPKYHEVFDFSHTGENTGNMGAMGPGNYFSSGASAYGKVSQPYLINGIKETPIASQSMIDKGLIPPYISPRSYGINDRGFGYYQYLHASPEERLKYPQDLKDLYEGALLKAKEKIKDTPIESGRLWIDPALIENSGVAPRLSLTKIKPMEFMLRRNDGIKSLFPHPSLFIKDANGKIIINRNWLDPRVNFKSGGKIIEKFKNRKK